MNEKKKTQRNSKRNGNHYKKTLKKSYIEKFLDGKKCKGTLQPFEEDYGKILKFRKKKIQNIQKEMQHLLRKKTVPKKILPENDFYTFINFAWLKNAEKQINENKSEKYIVQYDDFRIVQNKVYYQLIEIVKNYIKNNKDNKKAKQINNVYQAGLRLLDDNQARSHLNKYINFLDKCRESNKEKDAWYFLGIMNKNEIISEGLPFVISLLPDEKDPRIARVTVSQPQYSLLDYNVYFNDGTEEYYKSNYKKHFFRYINEMFEAFFGKNHSFKASDVFDCEIELIDAMNCVKEKEKENDEDYNKLYSKEAKEKYGFDWKQLSEAYGFHDPPFFITNNINYISCGTQIFLKGWQTEKWRTYYIYIYMRQLIRFHKDWRTISYEFCGKFMKGQEVIFPKELMCVFNLSYSFNSFLTNEYIEKYADEDSIRYLKTMAEDLRIVFKRIVERNTWLQAGTKKSALEKLDHFNYDIGSPKILRKDPILHYTNDDVWENFAKINHWRTLSLIHLEGKPNVDIPVIDWMEEPISITGTQAYVVNAFYTPTQNGIYIPIAYIQKPFIDLEERGIEYNLATIGYTIAHEMCHSLDDLGSRYDHTGKLNNWWSEKDSNIFKRKQNDVIKQYEEFAKRDGIDFDASISIGEDLADITGLAICIEYLNDYLEKNKNVIPIRVLSFKTFMIYFAYQYRQKLRKNSLNAQLKTNPHPLDKYRTNIPLSRIQIFKDLYNVKPNDDMWWHNTDTIW